MGYDTLNPVYEYALELETRNLKYTYNQMCVQFGYR